ncbi:AAA family ATPase [Tardisphaera miroshnichenkoae]
MPVTYDKVSIKNVKSIENVSVDLGKLNVLVGPNGSGKTNFIEAFLLARSIIRPSSFPPYPFATWWGYQNLVYGKDVKNNVEFQVDGRAGDSVPFMYSFILNGAGDSVNIIQENLRIGDELSFERSGPILTVGNGKTTEAQKLAQPGIADRYTLLLKDNRYSIFSILLQSNPVPYGEYKGRVLTLNQNLVESASPVILTGRPQDLSAFDQLLQSFFKDVWFLSYDPSLAKNPSPPINFFGVKGEGIASSLYFNYGATPPKGYLNDFLEQHRLSISYNIAPNQTISLRLNEAGLQFDVPSIPDGYLKIITILYMLDQRPSLLFIDELENSLHLKLIELAISAFRSFSGKAVVTTHSPMVVDLVDPSELVLFERTGLSTVVKRITNPEALKKKLAEDGLALSESWLYGDLEENLERKRGEGHAERMPALRRLVWPQIFEGRGREAKSEQSDPEIS